MENDFNREPAVDPPEYAELPTCCGCDEIDDLTEVNGKLYCDKHLVEAFATAERRREFIKSNPLLWYEFFADAVDEHLDPRVTEAFLNALEQYDPGNDVEAFCGVYAEDEFTEFVKGEVA